MTTWTYRQVVFDQVMELLLFTAVLLRQCAVLLAAYADAWSPSTTCNALHCPLPAVSVHMPTVFLTRSVPTQTQCSGLTEEYMLHAMCTLLQRQYTSPMAPWHLTRWLHTASSTNRTSQQQGAWTCR